MDDTWATGQAYEAFMGRWSRDVAAVFVRWLDAEPGLSWLDVGCGTGALTSQICRLAAPSSVVACDPSEPLVAHMKDRTTDPRVSVVVAGADDLPTTPTGFDRVVSGLVLNFLPDPRHAVRDMLVRARPEGVVAAYVWDYGSGMESLRIFWDEVVSLDPTARDRDEGVRFPVCEPARLEAVFRDGGLQRVRSDALEIQMRFDGFDAYWEPFLGGTGPAPSYVASLSTDARQSLRRRLEDRLGAGAEEEIVLTARAWAVRGSMS